MTTIKFDLNGDILSRKVKFLKGLREMYVDNPVSRLENYKSALHVRHDVLHCFVSELLHQIAFLGVTKRIGDYLGLEVIPHDGFTWFTPDIVLMSDNTIHIIDVAVSVNPNLEKQRKYKKYEQLLIRLKEFATVIKFTVIAVLPTLENLSQELSQLEINIDARLLKEFESVFSFVQQEVVFHRAFVPNDLLQTETEIIKPFRTELLSAHAYKEVNLDSTLSELANVNFAPLPKLEADFINLYENINVRNKLIDQPTLLSNYLNAFESLKSQSVLTCKTAKPSFHIIFVPHCDRLFPNSTDQLNIIKTLDLFSRFHSDKPSFQFINSLHKQLNQVLQNPMDNDFFLKKIKITTDERKDAQTQGLMSSSKPKLDRFEQLKVTTSELGAYYLKSGTHFARKNPEGRKYLGKQSCPPKCADEFDNYLKAMTEFSTHPIKFDKLLTLPIGLDSQLAEKLKTQFRQNFKEFISYVGRTQAFNMSYHTMLFADQLLHYNMLNTRSDSFKFINTGIPNLSCLVNGGTLDRGKDVGLPFLFFGYTDNLVWLNSTIGNCHIEEVLMPEGLFFFFVSSWRRMNVKKLAFIRDNYYSTLSTSFDTTMRHGFKDEKKELKFNYVFRVAVSLCTSQRLAEFLMDIKYLVMSCYSDFSRAAELITDKFAPHYPNAFTRWIVQRLEKRIPIILHHFQEGSSHKLNTPVFFGDQRSQSSTGGKFCSPSLWTNAVLTDLQDLFDEIFVYVHTIKEPSSIFYEEIKAIQTIQKFQDIFDKLSLRSQLGIHTLESFTEHIINDIQVGCWIDFCIGSATMLSEKIKCAKLKNDIDRVVCQENICETESTKACIPEYDFTILKRTEQLSKYKAAKMANLARHLKVNPSEQQMNIGLEYMNLPTDTVIFPKSRTGRAKVHDLHLDMLKRLPNAQTVLDICHWNLFKNSSKVHAHICIKAQYGAKREFYVLNYGSKLMVRIFENVFKIIGKYIKEEMISVPGDKKMIFMEQAANDVLMNKDVPNGQIYYVNGDCSKWSASETMASFYGLVKGFSNLLGEDLTQLIFAILRAWTNKQIFVPNSLLDGIKYITDKTQYLKNGITLQSTQNFLMGMFNYSSSIKAVCATNFAIHMWKKRWPERVIVVEHLEHSDDYCLIIKCHHIQDFVEFRIMHKLSQRLHGILDSVKKTNCQRYLMEFISLICYNGRLAYPHIKKTKEVGLNIGSDGYQNDIMNVHSRTGEAVRLGVPQCSAYVVQLIQGINIYNKYSISRLHHSDNPYNLPIELFGLPDCLPALYTITSGDINNYRLFLHSPNSIHYLKGLYIMTIASKDNPNVFIDSREPTFFCPDYSYPRSNRKISFIRTQLGKDNSVVEEYWQSKPEYQLIKPNKTDFFTEWLEFMYFNKSFSKAYSSLGRPALMLRLSFFVHGKCIRLGDDYLTLIEFWDWLLKKINEVSNCFTDDMLPDFKRLLSHSDPTTGGCFDLLSESTIIKTNDRPINPTISNLPLNFKFSELVNPLGSILQYHFSPERFWSDRRQYRSLLHLQTDLSYLKFILKSDTIDRPQVLQLSHLLKSQNKPKAVGLCFSKTSYRNPQNYITSLLEHNLNYKEKWKFLPNQHFKVQDPFSDKILFVRNFALPTDSFGILLENLSLIYYLIVCKEKETIDKFRNIIEASTFEGKSCLEIFNQSTFSLNQLTGIFHKRIFAFFNIILNSNFEILHELLENEFNIVFDFKSTKIIGMLKQLLPGSTDHVVFKFINKMFAACFYKNQIIVITKYVSPNIAKLSYTIAAKLLGKISNNQYEYFFTSGGMDIPDCYLPITANVQTLTKTGHTFNEQMAKGILTLPFITRITLPICKLEETMSNILEPQIDIQSATIYCQSIKLFSLPFWSCSDNFVITLPNVTINNINLTIWNTPSLLYNYFHECYVDIDQEKVILPKIQNPVVNGMPKLKTNIASSSNAINIDLPNFNFDFNDFDIQADPQETFRQNIDSPEKPELIDLENDFSLTSSSDSGESSEEESELSFLQIELGAKQYTNKPYVLKYLDSLPDTQLFLAFCSLGTYFVSELTKPSTIISVLFFLWNLQHSIADKIITLTPNEENIVNNLLIVVKFLLSQHSRFTWDYKGITAVLIGKDIKFYKKSKQLSEPSAFRLQEWNKQRGRNSKIIEEYSKFYIEEELTDQELLAWIQKCPLKIKANTTLSLMLASIANEINMRRVDELPFF